MLTLVGGSFMTRLRKSILFKIERGLWREVLWSMISDKGPVSTAGFNYKYHVDPDDDCHEAMTRRRIYHSSMALFAKIAGRTEMLVMYEPWLVPLWQQTQAYTIFLWTQ